ncbi:MAG: hypothetical protein Q3M30_00280 [Candidatus Electrothrix sp. Rat3]|nr:hypothetical protein [Candidatus Electrothrix rattekaaiensis]
MALNIKGGSFYFGKEVDAEDASFLKYFDWLSTRNNTEKQWPYFVDKDESSTEKKTDSGDSDDEVNKPNEIKKIYVYSSEKYWYGLVISGKTNQFQHTLGDDDGKLVIKAKEISGKPPVELNFFCIRKNSGKGIYSHYVGSYPFRIFISDLWGSYRFFVSMQKDKALLEQQGSKSKIKKSYSVSKKCLAGPLYTPQSFERLLVDLKYIDKLCLTTYEIDSEEDQAVVDALTSKRTIYRFNKEHLIDKTIKNWVTAIRLKTKLVLKDNKVKYHGALYGYNNSSNRVSIDFDKTLENFLEYDYDKIGTIELEKLFDHEILQLMISSLESEEIFSENK